MSIGRRITALLAALLLVPVAATSAAAATGTSYKDVVDMTFPVPTEAVWEPSATTWATKDSTFHYDAMRGSTRRHQSIDLMVPLGTPVYAAMGGTITWMPTGSYYMISIAGDDGRSYDYVHLGKDSPSDAYASGLSRGSRVERGQLIGYAGCSGSASCTSSGYHVHFNVEDDRITDDPYWPNSSYDAPRLDPYPSLKAARERGDVGGRAVKPMGPFVDVPASGTHATNVAKIAEAGYTLGCGGGRFCPDADVTRAEMATFLLRALSLAPAEEQFSDVAGGTHAGAIGAMAVAGITNGCGDGKFCPDAPVTRAQMGSFLARALELAPVSSNRFVDTPDGWVHTPNINAIAEAAITLGCGSGRYCPDETVTREQMASFLARGFLDG